MDPPCSRRLEWTDDVCCLPPPFASLRAHNSLIPDHYEQCITSTAYYPAQISSGLRHDPDSGHGNRATYRAIAGTAVRKNCDALKMIVSMLLLATAGLKGIGAKDIVREDTGRGTS